MSKYVTIDLLPPGLPEDNSAAGSPATITDGAAGGNTILGVQPGLRTAFSGSVYLKRIDAICIASGASGIRNLVLRNAVAGTVLLNLPVHSPQPRDLRIWEFPVPHMAGNDFALESPAGSGTWVVVANGFCL